MKMTGIEKRFVNSESHTRAVARDARALLDHVDFAPGWRYLDVGCGIGSAARAIAEETELDVTGIDVDREQIAQAQSGEPLANLQFRAMSATALEFGDGQFDVVACSMVTHHIRNWERVLAEMVRVLRPGGYLIHTDLMFPGWLAETGRLLVPVMGFPSRQRLRAFAAESGLSETFRSQGATRQQTVYRKPAHDHELS